jgi:hypothetical protein
MLLISSPKPYRYQIRHIAIKSAWHSSKSISSSFHGSSGGELIFQRVFAANGVDE